MMTEAFTCAVFFRVGASLCADHLHVQLMAQPTDEIVAAGPCAAK